MAFASSLLRVIADWLPFCGVGIEADDAPSSMMLISPPSGVSTSVDWAAGTSGERCGEGDVGSTDEGPATGPAESGIDVGTSKLKLLL